MLFPNLKVAPRISQALALSFFFYVRELDSDELQPPCLLKMLKTMVL